MDVYLLVAVCLSICAFKGCFLNEICSRQARLASHKGTIYFTQYYCCENYERYLKGCRKCPNGFTAKTGSECEQCPRNSFGERCSGTCYCAFNERCDNTIGCVKIGDRENPTTDLYSTKGKASDTQSTTSSRLSSSNLISSQGADLLRSDTVTKEGQTDESYAIHTKYIILFSCSSFGIIVMVFCVILICFRKHKISRQMIQTVIQINPPTGNPSFVIDEVEVEVNAYDDIDESNMVEEPFIKDIKELDTEIYSSSTATESDETHSDGYIYPYEPMVAENCNDSSAKYKATDSVWEYKDYTKLTVNSSDVKSPVNSEEKYNEVFYLDLEYSVANKVDKPIKSCNAFNICNYDRKRHNTM